MNYGDARAAESKAEFIHKMRVCPKALRETFVCLNIIYQKGYFKEEPLVLLLYERISFHKILIFNILTSYYLKFSKNLKEFLPLLVRGEKFA